MPNSIVVIVVAVAVAVVCIASVDVLFAVKLAATASFEAHSE